MRYIFYFCIVFLLSASAATASPSLSPEQTERIALYCKVWGLLKYFHPAVVQHNINWDSAFIKYYDRVKLSKSKEEFNHILSSLYHDAEIVPAESILIEPRYKVETISITNDSWIDDSLFTKEVGTILHQTKDNFVPQYNDFVGPTGGQPYFSKDSFWYNGAVFPSEPIRILALGRYWNMIEYFYPYKEGLQWDSILELYIPQIAVAEDTLYHLKMMELCTEITDGYSATSGPIISAYFGSWKLPIIVSYIEGKSVIMGGYPRSSANADSMLSRFGLEKGDVILKINGKDIDSVRNKFRKFVPHSNETALQNKITTSVTITRNETTAILTLANDSGIRERAVKYFSLSDSILLLKKKLDYRPWKILPSNIGYIDMSGLMPSQIEKAIGDLLTTQALILDCRGFSDSSLWHLMDFLTRPVDFAYFIIPTLFKPGSLLKLECRNLGTKKSKKKYMGNIIILVNETTGGGDEYSTMMFQAIPGAKTFGSQTAGADGNVSYIFLPGALKARMSGIGIYYPDGTPTQRVGLKIDFPVKPTIRGIREGRDEVLEAAVDYILNGSVKK